MILAVSTVSQFCTLELCEKLRTKIISGYVLFALQTWDFNCFPICPSLDIFLWRTILFNARLVMFKSPLISILCSVFSPSGNELEKPSKSFSCSVFFLSQLYAQDSVSCLIYQWIFLSAPSSLPSHGEHYQTLGFMSNTAKGTQRKASYHTVKTLSYNNELEFLLQFF